MFTNLNDIQRAVDIATHVNFDKGGKSDVRAMVKLTERLSNRQLRSLKDEDREKIEAGDPGSMKWFLGRAVHDILRRQAANIMADLLAQPKGTRGRVTASEEQLSLIVKAAKGDLPREGKRRLRVAQILKDLGMQLDAADAKREKRDPWVPTPIEFDKALGELAPAS